MATDTIKVQPVQPHMLMTEGKYSRRQFEEVLPMLTLEPSDTSAVSLVKTQACSKDFLFTVNTALTASSSLPQHLMRWLRGLRKPQEAVCHPRGYCTSARLHGLRQMEALGWTRSSLNPELFLLKGNTADGEGTKGAAREPCTKKPVSTPSHLNYTEK